jgi:hypothetical protein
MRKGELISGGASWASVKGHGLRAESASPGGGVVRKVASSLAHCRHLIAFSGALGEDESHLGLNSMRVEPSDHVINAVLHRDIEMCHTFGSHILNQEAPGRISHKGASELVPPVVVDGLKKLVELGNDARFDQTDEFLVHGMLTYYWLDNGRVKPVLEQVVVLHWAVQCGHLGDS